MARNVISRALAAQLDEHPGKWVAMTRTRIVAFGDTPADVAAEAMRQNVTEPIFHKIPDDHNKIYFL